MYGFITLPQNDCCPKNKVVSFCGSVAVFYLLSVFFSEFKSFTKSLFFVCFK